MNSERIKALADEISTKDIVLDVGCDHGYLAIYLKQHNLCQEVYVSDISKQALSVAQNNFKKYHLDIQSFLSDGFENIDINITTAVIAGMGTSNILKIIEHKKTPSRLVLASNNEHYRLRKELNKRGYKIIDEKAILEKGHYYIILLCNIGKQRLNYKELKFGISNNDEYYQYLIDKNNEIISKVPALKKLHLKLDNLLLKGLIERK